MAAETEREGRVVVPFPDKAVVTADPRDDDDRPLPLNPWLVKVYFLFPIVLYVPDAIFNYFVYSDGGTTNAGGWLGQYGFVVLWGFLALGVVGMQYLLSILAPWHASRGHHIISFFCWVGVLIATTVTVWCSLAFRSQHFKSFPTDQWVYNLFPALRSSQFSITMVIVAIAPPFWGLFWAIVQPTSAKRSLGDMRGSHEEKMLRMQQEAQEKKLKAETDAVIREARLQGMAATANVARQQAATLIRQRTTSDTPTTPIAETTPIVDTPTPTPEPVNLSPSASSSRNPAKQTFSSGNRNGLHPDNGKKSNGNNNSSAKLVSPGKNNHGNQSTQQRTYDLSSITDSDVQPIMDPVPSGAVAGGEPNHSNGTGNHNNHGNNGNNGKGPGSLPQVRSALASTTVLVPESRRTPRLPTRPSAPTQSPGAIAARLRVNSNPLPDETDGDSDDLGITQPLSFAGILSSEKN